MFKKSDRLTKLASSVSRIAEKKFSVLIPAEWRVARFGGFVVGFFLSSWATGLCAQGILSAPLSQVHDGNSSGRQVQASGDDTVQFSASIFGVVQDNHGSAIPSIPLTLVGPNNAVDRVVSADSNGAFTFDGLAPGRYRVTINAIGLEPYTSADIVLGAAEKRDLSRVAARLLITTTTVDVAATRNQVAQAQVQQQEKQRVLGLLPNFYSSYIWAAEPMTPKLKLQLTFRSIVDPMTLLVAASLAGVEQMHNTFPAYGQGSQGYAKRFGAAYADATIGRVVSRAILPTVLHQDPRYFYRGSGSVRSRFFYALAQSVVCRGDNGQLQPNYSTLLGSFAVAGISSIYREPGDRQAGLTLRHGVTIMGSGALENLLREFLSRKLTPNVPAFANGKP
jgi:Carboxypeptidase regulatory-like domain